MVGLSDFAAVKEYTGQLLADGTAQRLVPFGKEGWLWRRRNHKRAGWGRGDA